MRLYADVVAAAAAAVGAARLELYRPLGPPTLWLFFSACFYLPTCTLWLAFRKKSTVFVIWLSLCKCLAGAVPLGIEIAPAATNVVLSCTQQLKFDERAVSRYQNAFFVPCEAAVEADERLANF